jgi:hypothetical protein
MNFAVNILRLIAGLFIPNKHYPCHLRVLQIFSRFSWEIMQTVGGFLSALIYIVCFRVKTVRFSNGATIIQCKNKFGAFTLGCFIVGDRDINGKPGGHLFQHEYGHYLQSMMSGPVYLFKYGLRSLVSAYRYKYTYHSKNPVEVDANKRAKNYWDTHYQQGYNWDYKYNPMHEEVEPALLKWYDFIPVYFPFVHIVKAFRK